MKKTAFGFLVLLLTTSVALAQKGNNQIIPALEFGIPTGDFTGYKAGPGISAKALIGVGNHGQVSFLAGYTAFKHKDNTDAYKVKLSVIPFLIGYRYRLPVVYIEPQVGYGVYGTTIKTETGGTETKSSSSEGGFTWTLGAGVQISALDLGLRYQSGHPAVGTIGFFGIHAGYVFSSKKS